MSRRRRAAAPGLTTSLALAKESVPLRACRHGPVRMQCTPGWECFTLVARRPGLGVRHVSARCQAPLCPPWTLHPLPAPWGTPLRGLLPPLVCYVRVSWTRGQGLPRSAPDRADSGASSDSCAATSLSRGSLGAGARPPALVRANMSPESLDVARALRRRALALARDAPGTERQAIAPAPDPHCCPLSAGLGPHPTLANSGSAHGTFATSFRLQKPALHPVSRPA